MFELVFHGNVENSFLFLFLRASFCCKSVTKLLFQLQLKKKKTTFPTDGLASNQSVENVCNYLSSMCNYGKSNILALFGYWCLLGERTPWLRRRPPAERRLRLGRGRRGWGVGEAAERERRHCGGRGRCGDGEFRHTSAQRRRGDKASGRRNWEEEIRRAALSALISFLAVDLCFRYVLPSVFFFLAKCPAVVHGATHASWPMMSGKSDCSCT